MPLPCQRPLFDMPRDIAYLDCAAYGPIPRATRLAGEAGVATKSTPWAGFRAMADDTAEAVRAAVARLLGAAADDIAIVPSVAYGIATAAANLPLPPGHRIVLMQGEFPSTAMAWARRAALTGAVLDVVPRPADDDWTNALLARIDAPGLPPVAIASLTPLSWTSGAAVDLRRAIPALRAQGAAVVVDATQAAGVLPLAGLGADFVTVPTYKWLLGPYSLAFLYAAPHRQAGNALEQHAGNHVGGALPFTGRLAPALETARRYDMGERDNPVALPMALASLRLLEEWTQPALATRLAALTTGLAGAAQQAGLGVLPPPRRVPHILAVTPPPDRTAEDVAKVLAGRGVYVSPRGGLLRVSPHAYNDEEDVARFAAALGTL